MTASTAHPATTTKAQRRWLANLLLATGSLLLCLLILELGVRLFVDVDGPGPIAVYDVDLSTRIAFLPGRERLYETPEFRYTLKTNRFGRRDREWSDAELADEGNLLFVGDSFVMGASVEDEESIPTRLEAWTKAKGTPREVFNFGMPVTGIPQYVRILEDALRIGVKARTVLIGVFVGNDFEPGLLEPVDALPPVAAAPPRFAPHSLLLDVLRRRVSQSSLLVGWMLQLGDWLGVRLYNTNNSYIFLRNPPPDQIETFDRFLDKLREIQEICERHGRDLYIVVFPNKIQVENHESLSTSVYDTERPNRRIAEYCASQGLRCFDQLAVLSDTYAREGRPPYFPVDRHLNQMGNRIAADSIAASLERAHALAPNPRPQQRPETAAEKAARTIRSARQRS